jgi:glutamyl-tRNA synthetase
VGDARIALFNWLLARRFGGTFVLRVEDSHGEPSSADTIGGILDGLRWLGLTWDEGPDIGGPCEPYTQSARIERHRAAARRLLLEGHAYYCYCAPDRLRDECARAEAQGETWQYDRTCLGLSIEQVRALEARGVPRALRFKVPGGRAAFDDDVYGRIEFDGAHIEDFIVLGSDGEPAPQLAVVVADAEMGITHVIRGEEHLPDTPAHVMLFQALGAPVPRFAHVPHLDAPDRKRLGSPHGAPSVGEYRRQGYLPEAIVNTLALIGWSPGDERELMSAGELARRFSLEGISRDRAAFDAGKLDWMNRQHLAQVEPAALAASVRPLLAEAGLGASPLVGEEASFHRLLELLRPRVTRVTEMVEQVRPIVEDVVAYEPGAVERHLGAPELERHVRALVETLGRTGPFDEPHVEAAVRRVAAAAGIEEGLLADAVRVAVTGRTPAVDLFALLALIGRERTVARLERLLLFLSSRP